MWLSLSFGKKSNMWWFCCFVLTHTHTKNPIVLLFWRVFHSSTLCNDSSCVQGPFFAINVPTPHRCLMLFTRLFSCSLNSENFQMFTIWFIRTLPSVCFFFFSQKPPQRCLSPLKVVLVTSTKAIFDLVQLFPPKTCNGGSEREINWHSGSFRSLQI